MRYRLRTLLIVLALGPPVLAGLWWLGTNEVGLWVLIAASAIAMYWLFVLGTGLVTVWLINGIMGLIGKLQGRK